MEEETYSSTKTPVTLVTGFLGSGKTTFIQRLLKERHGMRIAVLQNEFSTEMGIEKPILSAGGASVFELPNGCLCCSLKDGIVEAVESILKFRYKFDWLVVEAAGNADPVELASNFWMDPESPLVLDGVLSITCPAVLMDIMVNGNDGYQDSAIPASTQLESHPMSQKGVIMSDNTSPAGSQRFRLLGKDTMEGKDIRELMIKQLSVADAIIVNKVEQWKSLNMITSSNSGDTQQGSAEEFSKEGDIALPDGIKEALRQINPTAKVLTSRFCKVDFDAVMNMQMFNASRIASLHSGSDREGPKHQHQHKQSRQSSVCIKTEGIYSLSHVNEFVSKLLWETECSIYRCKGIFHAKKDCDMIVEASGDTAVFQLQGVGMLFEITEVNGITIDDNRFLFIGPDLDRSYIEKGLSIIE